MKKLSSIASVTPLIILRSVAAWALPSACLLVGTLSSTLAESPSDDIRLETGNLSSEGRYQFSFSAKTGQVYPIGVSVDLVHWTLLTNVVGAGGPLSVADLHAPQARFRFYRIGVPETPFPNMVFIHPGTFTMGSPESETGRRASEGPQTVVTLTRGFWMGKWEVTQDDYVAVVGSNDSLFTYNTKLPAEMINWELATNYCHKLNERERAAGRLPAGYIYRLPTEAEWEYACRAGTTTPFGIGDGTSLSSAQANFDGNFPYGGAPKGDYVNRTTLATRYPPNAWGLYDMHGNVAEWCQDWYGPYPGGEVTDPKGPATGTERALRGGGFTSLARGCRSAERDGRWAGYRNSMNGFRVVLAPE